MTIIDKLRVFLGGKPRPTGDTWADSQARLAAQRRGPWWGPMVRATKQAAYALHPYRMVKGGEFDDDPHHADVDDGETWQPLREGLRDLGRWMRSDAGKGQTLDSFRKRGMRGFDEDLDKFHGRSDGLGDPFDNVSHDEQRRR